MNLAFGVLLFVPLVASIAIEVNVTSSICPAVVCTSEYIPENCRKPQYELAPDGQTRCRVCDGTWCEPYYACPQIQCPNWHSIPDDCRKPQMMIGMDGITVCTMCPVNGCEDAMMTCPPMELCPDVPAECRVPQFVMGGLDGITLCPDCDRNGCPDPPPQ